MTDQEPVETPEGADAPIDADVSPEPQAADAKPEDEGDEAESSPAADPDSDKEPVPLMTRKEQDRWDTLTRRSHEAERNSEAWRDQAQRLQSQLQAQTPPEAQQTAQPEVPKTLADFGHDETLYRNHLVSIAEERARVAARGEYDKYQQQQAADSIRTKYNERADKFAKTKDDYHEVATRSPISDEVANLVMHLDAGPEVAYFLGLNHDIARSISSVPIEQAAMELGRIDQRLSVERKRTKPVSNAPPPPKKIEGSETSIRKRIDDPKLTDKEFGKMRRKQIEQRGFH